MSQIIVDTNECKNDLACVAVCPSGTLAVDEKGLPVEVPDSNCIFCGHCVSACGPSALTHTRLPDEAFLPVSEELPTSAVMDGFLMSRRSVREFKQRPVARETLEALLEVARRAPTASNSQRLHWIVVSGKEKIRALADETMNWLRPAITNPALLEKWDKGYDFVLRGAPTLVVACAPADYAWGKQDCAIALTYIELAAESRKLGACWAGYLTRVAADHAPLRAALAMPEGYVVCGGLMLGEGKYKYHSIPPRKPLSVQWS